MEGAEEVSTFKVKCEGMEGLISSGSPVWIILNDLFMSIFDFKFELVGKIFVSMSQGWKYQQNK